MIRARPRADNQAERLRALLRTLTQGDIVSFGAVNIVGYGASAVTKAADTKADTLWSLTVDSEVGWYAIISSPCEIDREPEIEPCIAIAPVVLVNKTRYFQLRSGEYSPREFALPVDDLVKMVEPDTPEDFWPVVDLRFITSVDKAALLNADVVTRRPLTGPQQKRFALWVGRRFNRPADSNELEDNFLGKAGRLVGNLAGDFAAHDKQPQNAPLDMRLAAAAIEWRIGGSDRLIDRLIDVHVVVDAASCKRSGFYSAKQKVIDEDQVGAAAKKLAQTLRSVLPDNGGYAIKVTPMTLDGTWASEYIALEPWLWADQADPLNPAQ